MASVWRYCLAVIGIAALVVGVLGVVYLSAPGAPDVPDLDLSRDKPTTRELFVVSVEPEGSDVRQGELHSWVLTLKTPQGHPVEGAEIVVSGGMPEHDHALPTSPKVTAYLGDGRYRVEGMKFTMRGLWELRFAISAPAGSDEAVFNLVL